MADIVIRATWDDEANVWVATSTDVVGLVAEAPTLDALEEKLKIIIPELIELNGAIMPHNHDVPVCLLTKSNFIAKMAS